MGRAKEKPLDDPPASVGDDEYRWCMEQAELLRQRRFAEVDYLRIAEELREMGNEQRRALRSAWRVLLLHLLKWEYQPSRHSRSWAGTIERERDNIREREEDSATLRRLSPDLVRSAYAAARRGAAIETGLPAEAFPAQCPYSLARLRDFDWLPGQDKEEQE